jgi:aminopeptidase-like protein
VAYSLTSCLSIVEMLEANGVFFNQNPRCEPQLGRRGLYASMGGHSDSGRAREAALLWVLNLSDGSHSLLDIAERSGLPFAMVRDAAASLMEHNLLGELPAPR